MDGNVINAVTKMLAKMWCCIMLHCIPLQMQELSSDRLKVLLPWSFTLSIMSIKKKCSSKLDAPGMHSFARIIQLSRPPILDVAIEQTSSNTYVILYRNIDSSISPTNLIPAIFSFSFFPHRNWHHHVDNFGPTKKTRIIIRNYTCFSDRTVSYRKT